MAAINPKVLSTPSPQGLALRKDRAADSVTWKKGEIGYKSSGLWTPVSGATGGTTAPYCIFAEDQTTSTSSSDVWIKLVEVGTRCEFHVTNNGTDSAIANSNLGTKYGLYTASNVTYIDLNVTSGADWEVERVASDYEPENNAAADAPGKCIAVLR